MSTLPVHPEPPRRGVACVCQDPEVDRLRDLIAQGVDQVTASQQIWPPDPLPAAGDPTAGLEVRVPARQAQRKTLRALAAALLWLPLPTESEVS